MKRLSRLIPLIILVYLFSVSTSFADSLQVNFSATVPVFPSETVSGSFLWDTQTQLLSNISLTSSGPFTTDPPLFPGPGVHFNLPIFDICGVGIGCNPGTGDVTVSAVAEPGIALLLIFGVLVLGAAFALKHLQR